MMHTFTSMHHKILRILRYLLQPYMYNALCFIKMYVNLRKYAFLSMNSGHMGPQQGQCVQQCLRIMKGTLRLKKHG